MIITRDTTFDNAILPEVFYKYRRWSDEKEKRLITHSEIYFSQPFESDIRNEFNFEIDTTYLTQDRLYEFYFRETGNMAFAQQQAKTFQLPDNYVEYIRKQLNERFFIFCVSVKKDNYNLWETFAELQKGFCIGIDLKRLFSLKPELLGAYRKIEYYKLGKIPKFRPYHSSDEERLEDMFNVIFSQPEVYSKEKEYRFSKMDILKKTSGVPAECIKEIILGSQFPQGEEREVISLISENFPDSNISKAHCDYDNQYIYFSEIKNAK